MIYQYFNQYWMRTALHHQ
uniref:Uncharacterized protein n=1 Tax=Anguilla anguilla TaxID=7936 RepID=A0A0E9TBS6_ANGAN